ncbi:ATP-binding protein [Oscillatoria sp. FACHB-1406]|uniref:sensor histidine kinase n=1 Tax=Oscillatoria sp. FACHB-1406 TaxID=2692846 RepID=UPI0016869474|nr:ATP-binding protein [Oscillatoria sp. FACHB-1406]MBD2576336.1 hypothetical protein [Oscillatoria sp. FACHB-1406]
MFKLLRYFSAASLLAFVGATVLLSGYYHSQANRDLIHIEEYQNVTLSHFFVNVLWEKFEPLLTIAPESTNTELMTNQQIYELRRSLLEQIEGLSIVRVKIFDLNGRAIFSTDLSQIGKESNSENYLRARAGNTVTRLDHRHLTLDTGKDGDHLLSSYIPLYDKGNPKKVVAVFEIYNNVTPFLRQLDRTQKQIIIAIVLILGSLYSLLFAIVRHAERILIRQHSELRKSEALAKRQALELEQTLHQLQETQTQLIHSEKMAGLGQMVAGVAHEINNPISFIYGNLVPAEQYAADALELIDLYQQHYPDSPAAIQDSLESFDLEFVKQDWFKLLKSMRSGSNRIRQIVTSLRTFAHLDESGAKEINLQNGIDNTLFMLQNRLEATQRRPKIDVQKNYDERVPLVHCSPAQINQVFLHLFNNAIDALENIQDRPTIAIQTEILASPSPFVVIRIVDNGEGIPDAVSQKIFDPFFTTKPVGKGTGLGLTVCHQIVVREHGGRLLYGSRREGGTEFIVQLPLDAASRPKNGNKTESRQMSEFLKEKDPSNLSTTA